MRPIDEAFWHDYFDTHNNRRFVELVDRFYAPDADFENMRVAVKGREDIIAFLEESNEFVRIKLVPRLIITQGTVTAAELDCILRAEKDMPEFLLGPMEEGDEVTMRMAAVYHMDGDPRPGVLGPQDLTQSVDDARRSPSGREFAPTGIMTSPRPN